METIDVMSRDDLEQVLDWAAAEGWNPGLADAEVFHATDPAGFLIKKIDGAPAAAIAVVNHTPSFAFLGLYIAAPAFRGQGHGWDVWQAGLAHAGDRTVGLDGVPAQQANYARSGFAPAGRTVRYAGRMLPAPVSQTRPYEAEDLPVLLRRHAEIEGMARSTFLAPWLLGSDHRFTAVVETAGQHAHATIRHCRQGLKIGPLVADTELSARALLGELSDGAPILVDVPESSVALAGLLEREGFTPAFETARMYLGTPPAGIPPKYHAVSTLELG